MRSCTFDSPLGPVLATATDRGITELRFPPHEPRDGSSDRPTGVLIAARAQLSAWFAGELTAFDLALDLSAGTAFQQRVWALLCTVPYGTTTSYGALARRLDSPGASRAVGAANGRNPVAIVVPCHRVVGSTGAITGYAGGLDRKRWLLDHERARSGDTLFPGDGSPLDRRDASDTSSTGPQARAQVDCPLTEGSPAVDALPAWSPDGTRIAVKSDRATPDSPVVGTDDEGNAVSDFELFVMDRTAPTSGR